MNKKVDVIIPVYKPDQKFLSLLKRLKRQTYPVNRIIIMNTDPSCWDETKYGGIPGTQVYHLEKADFDHGRTRNQGASHCSGDIMIFMTDDALPADPYLVERLAGAFENRGQEGEEIAQVYARQLPARDCRPVERLNREYNYPKESRIKTGKDLGELGIKTYFASNVCCAYRRDIFVKQGGFIDRTIFNEDMIYAAGVIKDGYAIMYEASARVIHSHNFSAGQQFRRNFDLAVSQADHPEVFQGIPSEGEGSRMVKKTAGKLIKTGQGRLIPSLIFGSGCKYLGYRMGKSYKSLPLWMVRLCTSNTDYWNRKEKNQP